MTGEGRRKESCNSFNKGGGKTPLATYPLGLLMLVKIEANHNLNHKSTMPG